MCVCRQPEGKERTISCSSCYQRFHVRCLELSPEQEKAELTPDWRCGPCSQTSSSPDEIFDVEAILARRSVAGKKLYRVRWKGYAAKYDTWEPVSNLVGCDEEKRKVDEEADATKNQLRISQQTKSGTENEVDEEEEDEEESDEDEWKENQSNKKARSQKKRSLKKRKPQQKNSTKKSKLQQSKKRRKSENDLLASIQRTADDKMDVIQRTAGVDKMNLIQRTADGEKTNLDQDDKQTAYPNRMDSVAESLLELSKSPSATSSKAEKPSNPLQSASKKPEMVTRTHSPSKPLSSENKSSALANPSNKSLSSQTSRLTPTSAQLKPQTMAKPKASTSVAAPHKTLTSTLKPAQVPNDLGRGNISGSKSLPPKVAVSAKQASVPATIKTLGGPSAISKSANVSKPTSVANKPSIAPKSTKPIPVSAPGAVLRKPTTLPSSASTDKPVGTSKLSFTSAIKSAPPKPKPAERKSIPSLTSQSQVAPDSNINQSCSAPPAPSISLAENLEEAEMALRRSFSDHDYQFMQAAYEKSALAVSLSEELKPLYRLRFLHSFISTLERLRLRA